MESVVKGMVVDVAERGTGLLSSVTVLEDEFGKLYEIACDVQLLALCDRAPTRSATRRPPPVPDPG